MFFLFNRPQPNNNLLPQWSSLDNNFYPLQWENLVFETPQDLLVSVFKNHNDYDSQNYDSQKNSSKAVACLPAEIFSKRLYQNDIYQQWINFTVYGRYIQRSFTAFSLQSEDSFNKDMPELLKYELIRHAQHLPLKQVLFMGGQLPATDRQNKVLLTTLNPFYALQVAKQHAFKTATKTLVVNQIEIQSDRVKAFAVKHNKRTRNATRHEIIVLDFAKLVQIHEMSYVSHAKPTSSQDAEQSTTMLLKQYKIE